MNASSEPTIALCIPAYNAAAYLPRILQSAHNQVIPFNEILVYNDCSTDNTEEVALQYRAKVVKGDVNRGCSFGKNKLAEITWCDWIHFHDADDELLPEFTTIAHRWVKKQNCPDVVLFNYEYRDNKTDELISVHKFDAVELEEDPISYTIRELIKPFCGLYRRKAFLEAGGYDTDPKVLYNEDCAMHINLALNGLSFSAESQTAIINYKIGNSMSVSNPKKCILAEFEVTKKTLTTLRNMGRLEAYCDIVSTKLWSLATSLAIRNEWKKMEECITLAKRTSPSFRLKTSVKLFDVLINRFPVLGFRLREYLIRVFKPYMR